MPSREDDNFNPGTRHGATGGSPPPLLASSAQLFDYRPLSLTCIYVSVRAARLWCSMRTPLQPGCARARHRDLNAALRAAGSTRFFGSCAHWHMRGFLRRCGCSRAEVSAPGGSLAVARHAAGTHDARSRVTSRWKASRGSARNRQESASVVMLQTAAERDFCCGTPPRPPPPSSSRPSSSSPRSHPELVLGVWPLNLQQAAPLLRQHPQM